MLRSASDKRKVVGSSPARGTIKFWRYGRVVRRRSHKAF